jgi:hypothetical protein
MSVKVTNLETQSPSVSRPLIFRSGNPLVDEYLAGVQAALEDMIPERRKQVMARAMAEIELDMELEFSSDETEAATAVLTRLGDPAAFAARSRVAVFGVEAAKVPDQPAAPPMASVTAMPETVTADGSALAPCRICATLVSKEARTCPKCGAPNPVIAAYLRRAYGYEWKSKYSFLGYPLVHIAFGRDKNGKMRVAKGVIAIGQFGIGVITIAQFGIGYIAGIGQFMLAPISLGQFAVGLVAIGQVGMGALMGIGQFATGATTIGHHIFPR